MSVDFKGHCPLGSTLPVVDDHDASAGNTGHAVHLLRGERRQDEDAGLVVANAALVLHLDVVRVDLGPGQHIEGAVVRASEEDASPTVMSAIGDSWVRICYMMKMIQI